MSRKSRFWPPLLAVGCVALGASSASAADDTASGFMPDITIAEIMESIVMPSAQLLWDAAVSLAEATNSLVIPGRHAAPPGTESENPESELAPAAIEALLAKDRPAWVAHAAVLHATAMQAISAVDARDLDKISEVGGAIDEACESCHLQFWYPDQK
jgi:hypothetical protein